MHVDIFELKPETKNQKTDLEMSFDIYIYKRISIWNFFIKVLK